jgi:hypothetical protein
MGHWRRCKRGDRMLNGMTRLDVKGRGLRRHSFSRHMSMRMSSS